MVEFEEVALQGVFEMIFQIDFLQVNMVREISGAEKERTQGDFAIELVKENRKRKVPEETGF